MAASEGLRRMEKRGWRAGGTKDRIWRAAAVGMQPAPGPVIHGVLEELPRFWEKSFFLNYFHFIYLFLLFRSTCVAYGISQARGQIGATAAGLCHSHATQDPSGVCELHHSP